MVDSGGHWANLSQLQKLTQSTLVPGVFEEDIKRENLVMRLPVVQAANTGKSIKWLRESVTAEAAVADITVGQQLAWSEDIEYDEVETALKISYLQRKLDKFVQSIYGNINNYEAQVLLEMKKGVMRKLGDKLVYNDITYGPGGAKEFDGLHALAAEQTGTDLDIDNAEAGLSLYNLRKMIDAMKYGCDELWFPYQIARRLDAAYGEAGIKKTVSSSIRFSDIAMISYGWNEAGRRQMFWDGIPIIRTDYLVAEWENTGDGSSLRAKYVATGDKQYSIFGVKRGNVIAREPGLGMGFGGTNDTEFFGLDYFPKLEDYLAAGMRLYAFVAPLLASTLCLGRIFDIEDVAVTA